MKKLLAIICILLVIFIGMYINKNKSTQNMVTATEVENVQEYISKIYMWKEVTEEALPKFDNINDAPDVWTWEVVKKNIEKYEGISSEYIQETAKKIFGPSFAKQISQSGNTSFEYQPEEGKYIATNVELDTENDKFLINKNNP